MVMGTTPATPSSVTEPRVKQAGQRHHDRDRGGQDGEAERPCEDEPTAGCVPLGLAGDQLAHVRWDGVHQRDQLGEQRGEARGVVRDLVHGEGGHEGAVRPELDLVHFTEEVEDCLARGRGP
jgi:hypothetical protein